MIQRKLLILGLDGMNWQLINALSRHGVMEEISSLRKDNAYGVLHSVMPPMTGPAWASFATGVYPEKHGVHNPVVPEQDLNSFQDINSRSIEAMPFYEILEKRLKKRVVLINLPLSAPARISGPTVFSFFSSDGYAYHPHSLIKKVPELANYSPFPDYLLGFNNLKQTILQYRRIERERFNIAKQLFTQKWDCFFTLFSLSDWVQHKVYDELLDKKSSPREFILDAYRDIQLYVSWFLQNKDDQTDVLLLSDHGFQTYSHEFYINEWLKREGLLSSKTSSKLSTHEKNSIAVMVQHSEKNTIFTILLRLFVRVLTTIPYLFILCGIVARSVTRFAPFLITIIPAQVYEMGLRLDLSKTMVVAPNTQTNALYLNLNTRFKHGIVSDSDRYTLQATLVRKLKSLRVTSKKHIFSKIYPQNTENPRYHTSRFPDLLFSETVHINRSFYAPRIVQKKAVNWHHPDGIMMFIDASSNKKSGKKLPNASMVDMAPTILSFFGGKKFTKKMDGKVLPVFYKS